MSNKGKFIKLTVLPCEHDGELRYTTVFPSVLEYDLDQDTLPVLQEAVEGYIDHMSWVPELNERYIDMWINDEGKLENKSPCLIFKNARTGELIDVVVGNIVISRFNTEGETVVYLNSPSCSHGRTVSFMNFPLLLIYRFYLLFFNYLTSTLIY